MKSKEEEANAESGSQGAFNEETGEINWDCPVRFGFLHTSLLRQLHDGQDTDC